MHTEILMSNLMFVPAFGMLLEKKKCMKPIIICYCQAEIRLLAMVARVGRDKEWRDCCRGADFSSR